MTTPQTSDSPARPVVLWSVAAICLAVVIVIVTVAGVLRIVSVPSNGEAEIKFWVSVVTLLVGLTLATVVGTCAVLIRRAALEPADDPDAAPPGADLPPPPPPRYPEPEYVPGGGWSAPG
jgi:hypothetical protein